MKTKKLGKTGQYNPKQIEANKLKQLKIACEKMVGKGSFDMFSALCKNRMTSNRLPALKLKLSGDHNIDPSEFKRYNDLFVSQLNKLTITTLTGETMTLGQYLREAMTLVCYSEIVHELGSANTTKVRAAFEGYQRLTFTQPLLDLMQLIYRFSTLMSDLSASVLEYELNPVFAFGGDSENNHIIIRLIKSRAISIKLDGTKREVIPLQWPNYRGNVTPVSVSPISIGLKHPKESLPVYIQRHALRRLSERIGIVSGLLHQALVDCFKEDKQIRNLTQGGNSLVEFNIYDQKLGYLVCLVHEEMIVIRTFLFLTNDGTPIP
ncbi:hypothetical protein [Pedobacter psychroterrae]|uniref:Uncharacterized protein n=1 Tax=Pedobacter psychroterrae TaxID=2530453 RepID=A0A4R0NH90_9SPHI|nr:hypothetical protein [Pedobacter psychroterrae]TCC99940.1 hypothetical protein EZ437_17020 [Pedobacter psychroterrae]